MLDAERQADLTNFAEAVRVALAGIPADSPLRFGQKFFIAALGLHKAVAEGILVECHRAGLLRLTRCDLACAFPADLQAKSEVRYMHAAWHFVECV